MKHKKQLLVVALVGLLALALSACGGAELGTEENPIVWVLVPSSEAEGVLAGFGSFTDMVYDETGLVIEPFVATSNAAAIEALCAGEAHMGALNTFSTVVAIQRECVDVELVAVRFGSPFYNGQMIAHVDAGVESIADFAGKTFCRDDEFSTSSWIIPSLELRAAGVDPDSGLAGVVDAGGHDLAIIGILDGQCDVGASYVDARGSVEDEFPDVMDLVEVVAISADIPNDGVQYAADFPQELRDQLNPALISVAASEAGAEALSSAYSWDGLEQKDNSFYDPFLQVLEASGFDISGLVE
jgi:phosphonate transport system substrate-binding protein